MKIFRITADTPRNNVTAPAANVKENAKEYTMGTAVTGIKKVFCRVSLNSDDNLYIATEDKLGHKEENNAQRMNETK